MAKIGRPGLPSDKRQEVWERWKAGDSISVIAKAVASPPGSIFSILLPFGGIYQPPQRRRAAVLSLAEREEISRGVAAAQSYRATGRRLGRPASTISREGARNRGAAKYRAVDADDRAWRRAKRPKPCLLARRPVLAAYVRDRLRDDWSPEQIAGTLKKQHADGSAMRVSHETIYRTLFVESRGVLARELRAHLRSRGRSPAAAAAQRAQHDDGAVALADQGRGLDPRAAAGGGGPRGAGPLGRGPAPGPALDAARNPGRAHHALHGARAASRP